ncbi:MAG: hypothetical protein Ct9H90mP6_05730 [Gammaproteobacteria bacterium]|nr:MAG: hypothetical protein Ct9H90mP6_05730 [Gammaproteobacteria bacterium]
MPNINQDKVSHIKEIRDSVALFNDMKEKKREYTSSVFRNFI